VVGAVALATFGTGFAAAELYQHWQAVAQSARATAYRRPPTWTRSETRPTSPGTQPIALVWQSARGRTVQRTVAILSLALLSGCAATTKTSGPLSDQLPAPPAARPVCPPEARQASQDPPSPPPGVGVAALRGALSTTLPEATADDLIRWMGSDLPAYAGAQRRRADALAAWCLRQEAAPPHP
jgi:hypothetical protein